MKVKLNQTSAGPQGIVPAGTIIDVDAPTRQYLVDSRQAVDVPESFPVESENKVVTVEPEQEMIETPETGERPNRRRAKAEPPKEA